jgi:hypothetical protein
MTADERCQLILAFARVLYVNGQATEQTVSAAERLARAGIARYDFAILGRTQSLDRRQAGRTGGPNSGRPCGRGNGPRGFCHAGNRRHRVESPHAECCHERHRRHLALSTGADMAFRVRCSGRRGGAGCNLRRPAYLGCGADIRERRRRRIFAPRIGPTEPS